MKGARDHAELGELVFLCLCGAADQDQIARLESRLADDEDARRAYAEFLVIYAGLRQSPTSLLGSSAGGAVPGPLQANIQDISRPRPNGSLEGAETSLQPAPCDQQEATRDIERYARRQLEAFLSRQRRQERLRRYEQFKWDMVEALNATVRTVERFFARAFKVAKVGAVLGVIALIGLIVGLHIHANRVVATLIDSADAVWETPPAEATLRCGWMQLDEGFAQIALKKGAEVILQGPCEFELCSANAMFLQDGKMTAHVPKRATGFTVTTPTSCVVDFGTEFGLLTGGGSRDEVHVFDGRVRFKSARRRRVSRWDQALRKGQAATVDTNGQVRVQTLRDRPMQFVRSLPDANESGKPAGQLDLADMVVGGNGYGTGVAGRGIDPSTGAVVSTHHVSNGGMGTRYITTPSLRGVDGVFVPDGGESPAVVTSTGLVFAGFPDTNGRCHRTIMNGAVFQAVPLPAHPGRLVDYASETTEPPSIGMHANAAVTFDLEAIRRASPQLNVTAFKALCGVSETVKDFAARETYKKVVVDFWILVDGELRFSTQLAAVSTHSKSIAIPLEPHDRFLTLATTGPEGCEFCWAMFAEPMLELETK